MLAINAAQQYANDNGTCVSAKPVITNAGSAYNPFRQWGVFADYDAINACTITIVVTVSGHPSVSVTLAEGIPNHAGISFGFVSPCGYVGTTGGCPLYAGVYTTFDITITDTVNGYSSAVVAVTATPSF